MPEVGQYKPKHVAYIDETNEICCGCRQTHVNFNNVASYARVLQMNVGNF